MPIQIVARDPAQVLLFLTMASSHEITVLLQAWSNGDTQAFAKLVPLVDRELRIIAHAFMREERLGHTLQTTALVNEALMRFIGAKRIDWQSRKHFYALVAKRMRQILIEHARLQMTQKRGDGAEHISIADAGEIRSQTPESFVLLDQALTKLNRFDPEKAQIVEYRYFGGYSWDEIAEFLGVSVSTIEREWRSARAWLRRELTAR